MCSSEGEKRKGKKGCTRSQLRKKEEEKWFIASEKDIESLDAREGRERLPEEKVEIWFERGGKKEMPE